MFLEGKFARPVTDRRPVHQYALAAYRDAPALLIVAPCGYLLTSSLMAALEETRRPLAWLRFGPEDADPAACLLSLSRAMKSFDLQVGRKKQPAGGAATEREQNGVKAANFWLPPGTTGDRENGFLAARPGLPDRFSNLARETGQEIVTPVTLVLEQLDYLARLPQTLGLLDQHFLPSLPKGVQVILTMEEPLPGKAWWLTAARLQEKGLRLDQPAVADLLRPTCAGLPDRHIRRAAMLLQGKAVGLAGLCSAAALLGEPRLRQRLEKARSPGELLDGISHDCVATLETRHLAALNLLAGLGYFHPELSQAINGDPHLPTGPWLQPLCSDWVHLHSLWRQPLKTALHARRAFDGTTLAAVAEVLCRQDVVLDGVRLLIELGYTRRAAGCLAENASRLAGLGLWGSLDLWLELLPEPVVLEQPWLLAARGELKTCAGDLPGAMRAYRYACERFVTGGDAVGACTSLLALSTLATWENDLGNAWANADAARHLANKACLPGQEGWAEFQLACLAAGEGNSPSSLEHFRCASELARRSAETGLLECIQTMAALVSNLEQMQQRRITQQRQYHEAEGTERQQARRLELALQTPPVARLPFGVDWLQAPLLLKYSRPPPPAGPTESQSPTSRWKRIQDWLRARRSTPDAGPTASPGPTGEPDVPTRAARAPGEYPPAWSLPGQAGVPSDRMAVTQAAVTAAPDTPSNENLPSYKSLNVYMLGSFRIDIGGRPLEKLPVGRSGMLLKYLTTHHRRRLPREQLMEVFWPEADPETARNRLNVALSHMRQVLRTISEDEVVIFEDGKYSIDPAWSVWLDVEAFDRSLEEASRLNASHSLADAVKQLEIAVSLYQGDYLADDPYEEWTISTRERLRLAYLDTLYQLSRHYFRQEQYTACAALCQSILERDNCREDVHCLLMRGYARQGQFHLVTRQYQACVETLRRELEVEPAESTVALYERLRRGEAGGTNA
jgi:DNA-binding SARP family transcriptional activator